MSDEPAATPAEEPPAPPPPVAPEDRVKALYYVGETDPTTGEPVQYILGVPATDLEEAQIKLLSTDEYAACLSSGIYSESKPSAAKAKKGA